MTYVADLAPGLSDNGVIDLALRENRLLLTEDKDFGEMVFRCGRSVPGLVFLRVNPAKDQVKSARLQSAIDRFGQSLFGRYLVIEETRFRLRPLR